MKNDKEQYGSARPLELVGLAATGVVGSVVLGAITNVINGLVSPLYFVNIMGWQNINNIWRASIAQGILEGLIFGVILSLIFTSVTGFVSRASCPYSVGVRYLFGILVAASVCWVLGGVAAIALAALSPEMYRHSFIGVPHESGEMFKYAWVGGSIVGAQLGGFVCVVLGALFFRAQWHRQRPQQAA